MDLSQIGKEFQLLDSVNMSKSKITNKKGNLRSNEALCSGPKSGARAVRLLHGYEVDSKKLVAKVDAKNQQLLDTAKDEENKKSDVNNTRTSDAATEKKNDDLTIDRLDQILEEYKEELKAANSAESEFEPMNCKMNMIN